MLKILILICAVGMHQNECTVHTALKVIQGPPAGDQRGCGMRAQAYLAGSVIGQSLTDREYPKILCTRTSIGRANVG